MLNKAALISDLKTALANADSKNKKDGVTEDTALQNLASELGNAIDAYVRTATVTTVVTGTSATGGAVTGTGTGSLS